MRARKNRGHGARLLPTYAAVPPAFGLLDDQRKSRPTILPQVEGRLNALLALDSDFVRPVARTV